jgi:hypothetical protein
MLEHILGGGRVRGQRNEPGRQYEFWFNVELPMAGQVRFIKFAIDPEEDEEPGIVIISAHPPH